MSLSPVQGNKHVYVHTTNVPASLNILADTVVILKSTMESMQAELVAIRADKVTGHSDSWCQLNEYLNNSKQNRTITSIPMFHKVSLTWVHYQC